MLSACETALGPQAGGDGLMGFSQALISRGARALLVSLWPVRDTATSLLMVRFYENWLVQDLKADRPFEHPYYWSAFILIGDPN